ncbi:MAG: SCO family protein [Bacteroidales bacterium]|nr:SCO family protein [Bacteroidales bacterium]MCF8456690.1 SCO family protein [Bacteroidales bacterium]
MKKGILLVITGILLSISQLYAEEEIGIYEKLDQAVESGLQFTNDKGETVYLDDIIDKPTVISLVYFNCPGICSPLLDGVAEVIDRTDIELGKDYQVLTISFNWDEGWELARDKKKNYVKQIDREVDLESWKWMVGDSTNIMKLVQSLGYGFKKEGKDYIHAASIMVVSPEMKISRYLYGTYFLPFDLKMAVVEAAAGRSGPTINKMLKYCFSYDAEGKKYVFNITKVGGSVVMFFALSLFLVLAFSKKKNKKSA